MICIDIIVFVSTRGVKSLVDDQNVWKALFYGCLVCFWNKYRL